MNDNRDSCTGAEIHLPAYFKADRDEFDFYARLPDFNVVEVYECRVKRGRWIAVQMADAEDSVCVTAYCFSRYQN